MANLNPIYNATIRSEVAINSMKSDIRRIEEKVDSLTCMMQRLIDEQSGASNVTAPQKPMNNTLDFSSLIPSNERDIHKPSLKTNKYRKVAYIEEFIFQARNDLRINPADNDQERDRKNKKIHQIFYKLNAFTRTSTIQLVSKAEAMVLSGDICNWKNIPDYLKFESYKSLELSAKMSNIDLDRCIDSWAANKLISTHYHNATRGLRDRVYKDSQKEYVDSVEEDGSSYFGTDDEDDEPTIITAKRVNKQPVNSLKRRRTSKK